MFSVLVLLMMNGNVFAAREVGVEFNCVEIEFDQPAIISENRTLVPLRKIFETLGAEVQWDDVTRKVTANKNGRIVSIVIGSNELYVNGTVVILDVPAKIINNRTLVPARAISEAYECKVQWNDKENLVEIFELDFIDSPKKTYDNGNGLIFDYFSECELKEENENAVRLILDDCSMTVSAEDSYEVIVDDEYLKDLENGLENGFSTLKTEYVKKMHDKNIAMIKCQNRGNIIYYMFGYKNGKAYNIAITLPEGTEKAGKIIYAMKSFIGKW